jgi:hypothetical protein
MKRRDFLWLLATAAATRPLVARSSDQLKRIGVLLNSVETEPELKVDIAEFEQALRTVGWKLGQDVTIEYRWSVSLLNGRLLSARSSPVSIRT